MDYKMTCEYFIKGAGSTRSGMLASLESVAGNLNLGEIPVVNAAFQLCKEPIQVQEKGREEEFV